MKHWNYLQLSLHPKHLDQLTGFLWDLGTEGIEERYPKATEVQIKAYFNRDMRISSLVRSLRSQCRKAHIRIQTLSSKVEHEQDWFKKWRATLKPFAAGRRLYILPFKDRQRVVIPAGRLPIRLEPGMAFGTGTHETTQLCLEALEDYLSPGMSLLDVGTGSGILALSAVKLGAGRVIACDNDPVAVRIARSNAVVNRCASRLRIITGEAQDVRGRPFDLAVANLTLEIIEEVLEPIQRRLRSKGKLILSGVLDRQVSILKPGLLKNLFKVVDSRKRGEWVCLIVTKKTS